MDYVAGTGGLGAGQKLWFRDWGKGLGCRDRTGSRD